MVICLQSFVPLRLISLGFTTTEEVLWQRLLWCIFTSPWHDTNEGQLGVQAETKGDSYC